MKIPIKHNQIIQQLNATQTDYPVHCLHHFIEDQVQRSPDQTALVFQNNTLTYQELNNRANLIAHRLIEAGVKRGTIVGLCIERSFEMVIGLLAILKSGGAYLPLDPKYPLQRIEFISSDAGLSHILTVNTLKHQLDALTCNILYLDDPNLCSNRPAGNPDIEILTGDLAYVIYTSGSTGQPKGVMIEHRAIVNRLLWMQDEFQLTRTDRVLQKTPYSFDVSVWEFFWPLMAGARLVIAKPEGHRDNDYLLDLIRDHQISVIHFVPSMLRLFLESQNLERAHSIRIVISSGEALPLDLEKQFFSRLDSKLYNLYGPTEAAVDVSFWECGKDSRLSTVPIGRPIANIQLFILNNEHRLVSIGEEGELYIGGAGLGRGYLNRPELTAEYFIPNPLDDTRSSRLYKTGDLCRYLPDGSIEYLGRLDFQVKIRGFRIELEEIESAIKRNPAVKDCVVIVREDNPGDKRLAAYIIPNTDRLSVSKLQRKLEETLPEYMIPAYFVSLDAFPLTSNGKLDRKALPRPNGKRPTLQTTYIAPRTALETKLVSLWCSLLNIDRIGIDDNFFEAGGNSLLAVQLILRLQKDHGLTLPVVKIFEFPSISLLAAYIEKNNPPGFIDQINERATRQRIGRFRNDPSQDGVAVIGMSGRFPGAQNIDQLWKNLCDEVESITFFNREKLGPGIDEDLQFNPDYIPARGIIEDADKFDASFFGIGTLEARVMDPQQRIFLELAWAALENTGYTAEGFKGLIGVYAGVGDNQYYPINVLGHPELIKTVGRLIVGYGNEKDYIATRVSYALNLTGPSVSSNTGCSTSLLAVDNAVRALINFECDMALAGGIDIHIPQKSGFLYQEGGVFSKDGHCRPFDSKATGTLFNDGAGIVVLKRLPDALKDGDKIWAIIRGSAKNNDGANKVSFLAPSVEGQAQVIAMAQAQANILPEDISYIEAHGTGTPLGDPIEIEALTKAFRLYTDKKQFCLIGSVKGNIGHPTIASGVTGLIKTVLCLYYEKIPATLHFKNPNPKIDFENSPFKVVNQLTAWSRNDRPRIAGVSSFGFGGTNVHTIVEESPLQKASGPSRPQQLLLLSAKTKTALEQSTLNLKSHLAMNSELCLPDTAFTLQKGRYPFIHRRFVVGCTVSEVIDHLKELNPVYSGTGQCETRDPEVIFMFPGQGSQYLYMGSNLYDHEPDFRKNIDKCCEILKPFLACNIKDIISPDAKTGKQADADLNNTLCTQPALFMIEYALARLWQSWGIHPSAMIGHSVGEFVCACLSGVMSLEDALRLVAIRGRMMQSLPKGSMLMVRLSSEEIEKRLPPSIQLAAANSPSLCVISGPAEDIASFEQKLRNDDIPCKQLHTSHAFHSSMMDPIINPYTEEVKKVKLNSPQIPFISTVTATWITEDQAMNPGYWGDHLRMPVKFSHGIQQILCDKKSAVLLEIGPRTTLTTLALQHMQKDKKLPVIASLADTHLENNEWKAVLKAMGNLWLQGVTINWDEFYKHEIRYRVPLPTYAFDKKSYWVDPVQGDTETSVQHVYTDSRQSIAERNRTVYDEPLDDGRLMDRITALLEELSGLQLNDTPQECTFIEMGMDSLLLSQVAFKIHSEFGVKLSFAQLMRNYSNRDLLVRYIQQKTAEQDEFKSVDRKTTANIPETEPTAVLETETTIPQQGLWYSSQLSNALSCAYNESITLELTGNVNIADLKHAIQDLLDRHDALRASFSHNGKKMRIQPTLTINIPVYDLDKDKSRKFDKIIHQDASTPFDLHHGPLFRTMIIKNHGTVFVIMTSHHIVCDGWSLDILIEHLCELYTARRSNKIPKPVSSSSFYHYVRMVTSRTQSNDYIEDRNYWLEQFGHHFPVLKLPTDAPRPQIRRYDAERIDHRIEPSIHHNLYRTAKRLGFSYFNGLLAAYHILLAEISNQRDMVIGVPTAEQPLIGQNNLVGHCVNLIPFYCPVVAGTYQDYVFKVQNKMLEISGHLAYTAVNLMHDMTFPPDTERVPILSAGITNVRLYKKGELTVPECDVTYFANPRAFESFELYLNIVESSESIELKCHYNTLLFTKNTIARWLKRYEQILETLANHIDSSLKILPLPLKLEKKDVLTETTGTEPEEDMEKLIMSIWKKLFNKKDISIHDNFFDLGGHSLLAARFFAELEQRIGKAVPLAALFDAPTIAQLSGAINLEQKKPKLWKCLVPVRTHGNKPPIFLIHPAEGNLLLYRDLIHHLGDNQPVYGIQSQGLNGKSEFDATFENVAESYLKEILEISPGGPWIIGGYCLGGTIALEIAQRLHSLNKEVSLLFMIENYNINTLQWPLSWKIRQLNQALNLWYHLSNLFSRQNTEKWKFFVTKASTEISRAKTYLSVYSSRFWSRLGLQDKLAYHHILVDRAFEEALIRYQPRPYQGKILLFGAKNHLLGFPDAYYGWKEIALEGIELYELPIRPRGSLTEPYVKELASQLNIAIQHIQDQIRQKN